MSKFLVLFLSLITSLCAELTVVPERLSVDGLIWTQARFARGGANGWFSDAFEFQHHQATVGLTAKITPITTSRLEFDFSSMNLRDLWIEFAWANGLGLKLGQMKLPLSFNSAIEEHQLTVEEYSILYYTNVLKPVNLRDIGALGLFRSDNSDEPVFQALAGIVNGTGPNTGDNNRTKDIFARMVIKASPVFTGGGHIYYGWLESAAVPWLGAGVEARFKSGPFRFIPEFALRRYQNANTFAGDIKIETDWSPLAPAASLEIIRWKDSKIQWRGLSGINILPHKQVKILFGYQYHSLVNFWEYQALVLKLQAKF